MCALINSMSVPLSQTLFIRPSIFFSEERASSATAAIHQPSSSQPLRRQRPSFLPSPSPSSLPSPSPSSSTFFQRTKILTSPSSSKAKSVPPLSSSSSFQPSPSTSPHGSHRLLGEIASSGGGGGGGGGERSEAAAAEEDTDSDNDGVGMWSWGAGTDGQLGTGTLQDQHLPQPLLLPIPSPISRVACGGAHSIALTGDGRVLTWGRGTKGQLGHGELINCLKPKLVKSFENFVISYVSAGWNHSGFVTDSGRLFTCGDGSFGQLGTGDYQSHSYPVEVLYFGSKHVEQIACGMRHSLALLRGTQENVIYGFGSARHGQVGIPVSGPHRLRSCNLPRVIHGFENHNVVYICANGDQSAALSADGQLYTWGRGLGGSLGDHSPCVFPSSLRFSQVALGWNHALVLTGGEVYMLGGKHHGLLGSSQQVNKEQHPCTSSTQCTSDEPFQAPLLERVPCVGEEKVIHIAAGAEHSTLVTENGKIMTWGWGEHGQLGLGDTNDQTFPRVVNIGCSGHTSGSRIRVYCGSGFTLVVKQV